MNKAIGAGILGLVIGGAAGWGSMYARLQPVEQRASQAEAAREEAAKAAKALEGQLKEAQQAVEKLQAAGKAADQALGGTIEELAVIEAVDALYGGLVQRLLEAELDGADPEPATDLSRPPRTLELR